jgi:hypothetical protein
MGRATRRGLLALSVAALAATGLGAGFAQAATGKSSTHMINRSGTYNGQVWQTLPKFNIGHIHFIIRRGTITELRFTVGTLCGPMWGIDKDHALPAFPVRLEPTGAFSYQGTVAGRVIRLQGRIIGNRAHGTFFQSFSTPGLTCTMGHAAAFTATR